MREWHVLYLAAKGDYTSSTKYDGDWFLNKRQRTIFGLKVYSFQVFNPTYSRPLNEFSDVHVRHMYRARYAEICRVYDERLVKKWVHDV